MRLPVPLGAVVVALVASLSTPAALAQVGPGEAQCAALRQLQVPGAALSEVTAEWFAAGSPPPQEPPWVPPLAVPLPAYCRLSATLDRRTGADGRSYGIGFALALPAEWNGRFLFQGGGGLNGISGAAARTDGAGRCRARPRLRRRHHRHRSPRGGLRRVLHGGAAGEPRLRLPGGRARGRARAADPRAALRPARRARVLHGLLDRRARGHADGAAPSHLLRRHRRRRAGDAHALLRDRRRVGRDDAEPGGAARRVGKAGRAPRVLGRRSEGGRSTACSPPATPPTACATASSPIRSGAASIPAPWFARARRRTAASRGRRRRRWQRRSPARGTRRGGRCTRASRSTRASPPRRASRGCSPAARTRWARRSRRPRWTWTSAPRTPPPTRRCS